MAMELAEDDDIEVRTVGEMTMRASAPKEDITKRRGVAGNAGRSAERKRHRSRSGCGHPACTKGTENTRRGVSDQPQVTIPANGKPNFQIEPGTMEFGNRTSREPGDV